MMFWAGFVLGVFSALTVVGVAYYVRRDAERRARRAAVIATVENVLAKNSERMQVAQGGSLKRDARGGLERAPAAEAVRGTTEGRAETGVK